jgi:hypothetical protein
MYQQVASTGPRRYPHDLSAVVGRLTNVRLLKHAIRYLLVVVAARCCEAPLKVGGVMPVDLRRSGKEIEHETPRHTVVANVLSVNYPFQSLMCGLMKRTWPNLRKCWISKDVYSIGLRLPLRR